MAKSKSSIPVAGAAGTASSTTATSNPNGWFSTLLSNAKEVSNTFFENAQRFRTFTEAGETTTTTPPPSSVTPAAQSPSWLPMAALGGLGLLAVLVLRK